MLSGLIWASKDSPTVVTDYTHITIQVEPTYVSNWDFLGKQIGLAFSTLKTTYNRDRLMIPVSEVLL